MSYLEDQLNTIKNFNPVSATHYYFNSSVVCYFGVVLKNGIIDIQKFPNGRAYTGSLSENEHFICFKKEVFKDSNTVILYLRRYLDESQLNEKDLEVYLYIKENTLFESY